MVKACHWGSVHQVAVWCEFTDWQVDNGLVKGETATGFLNWQVDNAATLETSLSQLSVD